MFIAHYMHVHRRAVTFHLTSVVVFLVCGYLLTYGHTVLLLSICYWAFELIVANLPLFHNIIFSKYVCVVILVIFARHNF